MKTLLLFLLVSVSSFAQTKAPKLIAVATDQGGFPAKALCYFSNNYMVPHSEGLLVQYTCLGGPDLNSEIWLISEKPQNIGVSEMGNLFTEPFVRGNSIYFFEYNEFKTIALWTHKDGALTSQKLPSELQNSHVHDFALVGETFYFRFTDRAAGNHGEGIFTDTFTILPARGPEYFWKSASNGTIMLQKTKLAAGEVVELRTKNNHNPIVILRDRNADPSSPFLSLRNQFATNGNRWASFTKTDSGLALIRGKDDKYTTEDISKLFKDAQYWPPALSNDGEVIFRGTDMNNQFALWGYKNGVKRLVLGSNQEINLDSETVITSSRALLYNPPVFDHAGNLYIGVGLRSPGENVDFGQGILSL